MHPPTAAGMWWAGEGNIWPLSVIWNLERPSRSRRRNKPYQRKNAPHWGAGKKTSPDLLKKLQRNYKKVLQNDFKRVTIWLQQGQQTLLSVKSFSSCFLGYRAQVLLLRLFSFTAAARHRTGGISLRVQKGSSVFRTSFFASSGRSPPVKKGEKLMKRKRTEHRTVDKVLLYPDFLYKMTVFLRGGFAKFVL